MGVSPASRLTEPCENAKRAAPKGRPYSASEWDGV